MGGGEKRRSSPSIQKWLLIEGSTPTAAFELHGVFVKCRGPATRIQASDQDGVLQKTSRSNSDRSHQLSLFRPGGTTQHETTSAKSPRGLLARRRVPLLSSISSGSVVGCDE